MVKIDNLSESRNSSHVNKDCANKLPCVASWMLSLQIDSGDFLRLISQFVLISESWVRF